MSGMRNWPLIGAAGVTEKRRVPASSLRSVNYSSMGSIRI